MLLHTSCINLHSTVFVLAFGYPLIFKTVAVTHSQMLFITAKQKMTSFQSVFELQDIYFTSCLMSSAGTICMKLLLLQENILHINIETKRNKVFFLCCNVDEAQLKQLYNLASGMICDTHFCFCHTDVSQTHANMKEHEGNCGRGFHPSNLWIHFHFSSWVVSLLSP